MSSDKLYSDAVRSGLSSDEDVASPVASPIITGVSKKVFLQKSLTLNSETSAQGVLGLFSQSKAIKRSYSSLCARLEFKV